MARRRSSQTQLNSICLSSQVKRVSRYHGVHTELGFGKLSMHAILPLSTFEKTYLGRKVTQKRLEHYLKDQYNYIDL
jgi:hypothetical protein